MTTNTELMGRLSDLKTVNPVKDLLKGLKHQERMDKLLVILLDVSDSMGSCLGDANVKKIDVAWSIFQTQLAPNMAGWSYGVLMFGEIAWWVILPTSRTHTLVSHPTPTVYGSTVMGEALQMAWAWVKIYAKQARFIVLTDGMPNDLPKDAILALAKENASIPIDCVGIGTGYDYDPDFLRMLSSITGGTFCEAATVKLLTDTILKLSPAQRPLLGTVKEK